MSSKTPDITQSRRFVEMLTGSKTTPVKFTTGGLMKHVGSFAEHEAALVTANAAGLAVDVTVPGCEMVQVESPDPIAGVPPTVVVHVASPRVGAKVFQHWYVAGSGEATGRLPGFVADGVRCQVVSARDGLQHSAADLAKVTGQRLTKIDGKAASVAPEGSVAPEVQPAPDRGSEAHSASEEAPLDFDSMYGPVGSERNVEETTFQIAVGKTVKVPTGNQSITLTTLAEKIRKLGAVANKVDGYILHFAQFPQGVRTRTYANIEACTAAPFDFDGRNGDKVKREDFEEVCREAGVEVITWLTHSAPDDPTGCTFRAAMPYKEPLAVDLHKPAMAAIGKMLGMTPDKPLPATQGFFCQPRPGVEHDVRVLQGKPIDTLIDLHGLEPVTEAPPDHQERATGASHSAGEVLTPEQVADATAAIDALRVQGLHGITGKGVWHRVIGALAPYGEQGEVLALRFSEDGCKTWKADTLEKLAQKRRKGATGIGNLFAIAAEQGITNPGSGKRPAAEDEFADDLAGVFEEAPAPNLTPDVRKHMNACIDMALTLRDGGFRDLHGPVRAMQNDAGKVIRQNEDGTWQAEGGQAKDAADLLVSSIYKGDAAAAEAEWLVWAEDGEQMNWFSGHAGRSGAYSAQALVKFMRGKTGTSGHIGFSFSSTRDLLDSNVNPEWIVKGLVERSTVMAVAGPPKEGKSFVTYDMGMHVAAGLDWGNHKVTQGAVFVIAGEGHGGIARRVKAWHKQHPGHEDAPFFVSKRGALLDSDGEAKAVADVIAAMIDEHGVVPAVVILDTLARNMAGEENSNTDMSRLVKAVDVSFKDRFGFAVLIVHHSTKDGGELLRGASSLKGALDGLIEVRKRKQVPMTVEVITHFLKDGETPGKLTFECERVVIGIDEDMDEITSLVPKLVANTYDTNDGEPVPADLSRAMDALRTIDNGQVILLGPAREVLVKAGILKSANPSNQRGDAKGLFDKLVEKGLVRREGSTSKSGIVLLPVGWASFDDPPL